MAQLPVVPDEVIGPGQRVRARVAGRVRFVEAQAVGSAALIGAVIRLAFMLLAGPAEPPPPAPRRRKTLRRG